MTRINCGIPPRELCNKYHELHKQIYDWFNISFDVFGRTSTDNPKTDEWTHTKLCHEIFNDLVKNGFIHYSGHHCGYVQR